MPDKNRYPGHLVKTLIILFSLYWTAPAVADREDADDFEISPELPWLNVSRPLQLKELRGKAVLLDFWTYGCINCVHVLEDLKRLEKKYHPYLAVIGVHTPKFDREKNIKALRNIIVRYDIEHPVVNDVESQLGRYYGMRAWPTQVLIDPQGVPLGKVTGEGNYELLDSVIGDLLQEFKAELDPTPLPLSLERERFEKSLLAAPGKIAVSDTHIAISDTLHHRILISDHDGNIIAVFGGNGPGNKDGSSKEARFSSPQGVVFSGRRLYVADTGNHLIRELDLDTGTVKTIAGNGSLEQPRLGAYDAREIGLRSPWGLALKGTSLYIAMAGSHQIWRLQLTTGKIENYAGSGREGLKDGPLQISRFSQPSGLSIRGDWLYVADSEDSSIRRINLDSEQVETLVGTGLFDFGDRDGPFDQALLQHVLGVAAIADGRIVIADTYNHKLKLLDLTGEKVTTLAGGGRTGSDESDTRLNEPGGLAVLGDDIFIADTNNNRIMKYSLRDPTLVELKLKQKD